MTNKMDNVVLSAMIAAGLRPHDTHGDRLPVACVRLAVAGEDVVGYALVHDGEVQELYKLHEVDWHFPDPDHEYEEPAT